MHPALTRTTSDTLMWLRWWQLDLLLLLFFMIIIIIMIGHDSGPLICIEYKTGPLLRLRRRRLDQLLLLFNTIRVIIQHQCQQRQ